MKTIATIPIKAHSERVPRKNFAEVAGKPLYQHVIENACRAGVFAAIYVDSDSPEILEWVETRPTVVSLHAMQRADGMAGNNINGNDLLDHHRMRLNHEGVVADAWCQLFATAPFLRPETMARAVNVLRDHPYFDSVFTATDGGNMFLWRDGQPLYDVQNFPRSQDWRHLLVRETTGLYLIRDAALRACRRRIGCRPFPLMVGDDEARDIDWPEDLKKAQA